MQIQALRETARILPKDLKICGLAWGPITTAGYIMGVENITWTCSWTAV